MSSLDTRAIQSIMQRETSHLALDLAHNAGSSRVPERVIWVNGRSRSRSSLRPSRYLVSTEFNVLQYVSCSCLSVTLKLR